MTLHPQCCIALSFEANRMITLADGVIKDREKEQGCLPFVLQPPGGDYSTSDRSVTMTLYA